MNNNFEKSVHSIGRFTLIVAVFLSFVPFLYIVIAYNAMPPLDAVIVGVIGVWAAFATAYIVEPLSFFPALGSAGTYMSFLAGTIGQMRVPAARVAKDVAGVEDGTKEAELVAICGIAGSIYLNLAVITLTAAAGTFILAVLPAVVLNAIATYILAAIFGAVFAMFAKGRLVVAVPTFAFCIFFQYLIRIGVIPTLIARFNMLVAVIVGILIARAMYKKEMVK